MTRGAAIRPPTPDDVVCDTVREAEEIVCRAWESVLLERGDRMESTVQAAIANCHTAYRLAAEAHRGGDPDEISAAHTILHEALDVARRSSAAAQRIADALRAELDLLARTIEEHADAALADQAVQVEPEAAVEPGEPTDTPARERRSEAVALRALRSPDRLIRRLIRACTGGRRQP